MKQRRHIRTSKRGRKFYAGKGVKKVRRASPAREVYKSYLQRGPGKVAELPKSLQIKAIIDEPYIYHKIKQPAPSPLTEAYEQRQLIENAIKSGKHQRLRHILNTLPKAQKKEFINRTKKVREKLDGEIMEAVLKLPIEDDYVLEEDFKRDYKQSKKVFSKEWGKFKPFTKKELAE